MNGRERFIPAPATVATGPGMIEYAQFGAGPAVLALHGAMGGYGQGIILARAAGPAGYRYVAPSRPGYLGTPLATGSSPSRQADACAGLLDALGMADAAVIAVSGGGPCAMEFALRHPERCRALVLISTCAGIIDTPIPWGFKLAMLLAHVPFMTAAARRRALADPERAARRSIPDPALRHRTLNDPVSGPLLAAMLAGTFERMTDRLPGTRNDIEVTRSATYRLEDIAVPTLVVHGTNDPLLPYGQHALALARRIPGAELLTIDGGGHVCLFTHRSAIAERVERFLAAYSPIPSRASSSSSSNWVSSSSAVSTSLVSSAARLP